MSKPSSGSPGRGQAARAAATRVAAISPDAWAQKGSEKIIAAFKERFSEEFPLVTAFSISPPDFEKHPTAYRLEVPDDFQTDFLKQIGLERKKGILSRSTELLEGIERKEPVIKWGVNSYVMAERFPDLAAAIKNNPAEPATSAAITKAIREHASTHEYFASLLNASVTYNAPNKIFLITGLRHDAEPDRFVSDDYVSQIKATKRTIIDIPTAAMEKVFQTREVG